MGIKYIVLDLIATLPIRCSCVGLIPLLSSKGYTTLSTRGIRTSTTNVLTTPRAAIGVFTSPIDTSILNACRLFMAPALRYVLFQISISIVKWILRNYCCCKIFC